MLEITIINIKINVIIRKINNNIIIIIIIISSYIKNNKPEQGVEDIRLGISISEY